MTRLRVAIRVPVGRPLPDVAAFIARCEDAGFDGVGIHDHPSSGRDAYLALALAAQATQRLRLFPATSSPVVRHSLVLASLAQSLEEIAPGRKSDPGPAFPLDKFREKLLSADRNQNEGPAPEVSRVLATGLVIASSLNIRKDPNAAAPKSADPLPQGASVKILARKPGWLYVAAECRGWVSSDFVKESGGAV